MHCGHLVLKLADKSRRFVPGVDHTSSTTSKIGSSTDDTSQRHLKVLR